MSSNSGVSRKRHRAIRDSINGITRPAIRRLAHRAGVPRIAGTTYEEIKGILKAILKNIIKQAVIAVEHTRTKTIKTKHLEFALRALNPNATFAAYYEKNELGRKAETHRKTHTVAVANITKKAHKFRAGIETMRDIRRMQKSEYLVFSHHPFNRLVREITEEFGTELRYEARAMGLLRLYVEDYLVNLFRSSFLNALHAKRETVAPKDIVLARMTELNL